MNDIYAAVDCGTNSVRLLVVRRIGDQLVELTRRLVITRLGKGVDATGEFDPDSLAKTLAVFAEYAAVIKEFGAARIRVVATSAARDARNSAEFFAGARAAFGVDAEIIPGSEEAQLSFVGAINSFSDLAEPVLVMDIGGGSTELAVGNANQLTDAVSLNVGSVRLRERFLNDDPPTATQISAASAFINELLDESGIDFTQVAAWVGVGGTATALSAIALELPQYDHNIVHGSQLAAAKIVTLADGLLQAPVSQVARIPTMVPGRADVICAGALICREVGQRIGGPLHVSEYDILDGIIQSLLEK